MIIPNFTLKAVNPSDEMYVDEEGKHVIFRTIRGKVVPIQTTAEEYAEWLIEQGTVLDPADQTQLRQLDNELQLLEDAAQYGPEVQQKMEQAFAKQKEQYAQLVQRTYQQAMQQQAQAKGMEAEAVIAPRKQKYEESKDATVSRTKMPDRGWESYVEDFVDKMIDASGFEEKSGQWYTMRAFEVILRNAVDLARSNTASADASLDEMVAEELQTFDGLTRHWDNYAKYKEDEYDTSVDANMFRAVGWLKDTIGKENDSTQFLRDVFDSVYSRAYAEFHKDKEDEFSALDTSVAKVPVEMLPKELPEKFGPREAAALMGVYRNLKGSRLIASHRATIHTISRLYDSIPPDERVAAVSELSDASRGLHAVHQHAFRSTYDNKEKFGVEVDQAGEMEDILRIATRAGEGTTKDKIDALKKISYKLGLIDGAGALKDNPTAAKHRAQWEKSSLNAGRRKGDGPAILEVLTDPNKLKTAQIPNATLKIMHKGGGKSSTVEIPKEIQKTKPTTTNAPTVETPAKPQAPKPPAKIPTKEEDAVFTKANVNDNFFSHPDGFILTPGPEEWKITSPTGEEVGSVFTKGMKGKGGLVAIMNEAARVISNHQKESGGGEETSSLPAATFGFFNKKMSREDKSSLTSLSDVIRDRKLNLSTEVPGVIQKVSGGYGDSVTIGYREADSSVVYMDEDDNIITRDEAVAKISSFEPHSDTAMANSDVNELFKTAMEKGGATFDINTGEHYDSSSGGFGVAPAVKVEETVISKGENPRRAIQKFISDNKEALSAPGAKLGMWKNENGELVMDVSTVVMDRQEAIDIGIDSGQTSIYDFKTGQEILMSESTHSRDLVTAQDTESLEGDAEEDAALAAMDEELDSLFDEEDAEEVVDDSFEPQNTGERKMYEPYTPDAKKTPKGQAAFVEQANKMLSEITGGKLTSIEDTGLLPGSLRTVYESDGRPEDAAFRAILAEETGKQQAKRIPDEVKEKILAKYPNMPQGYGYSPETKTEEQPIVVNGKTYDPAKYVRVYRYENDSGEGPYTNTEWEGHQSLLERTERDSLPNIQTAMGNNPLAEVNPEYFSGVTDPATLDKWFGEHKEALESAGFKLREYVAPRKMATETDEHGQIAFRKGSAQRIDEADKVATTQEASLESKPRKPIGFEFTDRQIPDAEKAHLSAIEEYAAEKGLEFKKAGGHAFDVTDPETKSSITIAVSKKGELHLMKPGEAASRFDLKTFAQHFDPYAMHEPVKNTQSDDEAKPSRKTKAKEEVRITRKNPNSAPKEIIPWSEEEYGTYGATIDGVPTPGYARWYLANQGYRKPTRAQINKVIKDHKGIAPRDISKYTSDSQKSVDFLSILPNFTDPDVVNKVESFVWRK